jgi:hypothetical protein
MGLADACAWPAPPRARDFTAAVAIVGPLGHSGHLALFLFPAVASCINTTRRTASAGGSYTLSRLPILSTTLPEGAEITPYTMNTTLVDAAATATTTTIIASLTSTLSSSASALPEHIPKHGNAVVAFIIGFAIVTLASVLNAAGLNLTKLDHVLLSSSSSVTWAY